MADVTRLTPPVSFKPFPDGEERASEIHLAHKLGYQHVHKLRALIQKHAVALKEFGPLVRKRTPDPAGNRLPLRQVAATSTTERIQPSGRAPDCESGVQHAVGNWPKHGTNSAICRCGIMVMAAKHGTNSTIWRCAIMGRLQDGYSVLAMRQNDAAAGR